MAHSLVRCHYDSYCTSFKSKIVSCTPTNSLSIPDINKSTKNKQIKKEKETKSILMNGKHQNHDNHTTRKDKFSDIKPKEGKPKKIRESTRILSEVIYAIQHPQQEQNSKQKQHQKQHQKQQHQKQHQKQEQQEQQKQQEKKKKQKKKKKAGNGKSKEKINTYDVELSETILFPEGGGQPSDKGWLNKVKVLSVGHENGKVIHKTTEPLEVGMEVDVKVDWEHRYDHMQHHTGQHLISAIAEKMFGFKTISWWLAGKPAPCQIELDCENITEEQIHAISEEANSVIRTGNNTQVHYFKTIEEAHAHPYYRQNEKALPDAMLFKGIPLRVVEIPGVDFNKCCGTHLKNVAELQMINISHSDKLKGHSRIYFMCGKRAVDTFNQLTTVSRNLVNMLSTPPERQVEIVKKLQTEMKTTNRQVKSLVKEMAKLQAEKWIEKIQNFPATDKWHMLTLHRDGGNMQYLGFVADAVRKALTPAPCKYVLFMTVTVDPKGKEGQFLFVGPDDILNTVGKKVAEIMEGRGGGRKGRFQGKALQINAREKAYKFARQHAHA